MFDQFKAMGQVAALLKDKERLREVGDRVKRRLESIRAEGEAGGGAVRAVVNGKMTLLELELAPALTAGLSAGGEDAKSREMVQDLIVEAVNRAGEAAQGRAREAMEEEARDLGLPELPGGLGGLLGG